MDLPSRTKPLPSSEKGVVCTLVPGRQDSWMRAEAECDKPKPWRTSLIKEPPVVIASCAVGVPLEAVAVSIEGPCREQLAGCVGLVRSTPAGTTIGSSTSGQLRGRWPCPG